MHSSRRTLIGVLVLGLGIGTTGGSARQDEPHIALLTRAVQPGEVVRLDVTCRCADALPRVTVFGRDVALAPVSVVAGSAVHFAGLFGIDLDTKAGVYTIEVYGADGSSPLGRTDLRVVDKTFATRELRVAPEFVEPPPADVERITREAAEIATLLAGVTPRLWDGPFIAPVETRATSNFGTRSVFNGQPRAPHAGVDFSGPVGTPVVSPAAGRVVMAEDLFFTGKTVLIDHGLGLFSLLAHLSTMTVAEGDRVERGAPVGQVGATGRVTGPHLHWAIRLNGARVDPLSLLFATAGNRTEPQSAGGPASAPRAGGR